MSRGHMRLYRLVVACFFAVGACDKAPPELPPTQPLQASALASGPAPTTAVAVNKAACMRPLAAAPPAAPRYRLDPACPKDPAGGPPMVPIGHVAFPDSRDAPKLEVELMLNEKNQERGLMFRRSLNDDKGMLFAWSHPTVHTFWMHNTCIPLDMLFIDDRGYIAGIVENAPTLNDEGRSISCPASYVLEVNAGWSRQHGVEPGQKVQIDGVPVP
jgi:uncharacterized membrane protein (UPF0127 family)